MKGRQPTKHRILEPIQGGSKANQMAVIKMNPNSVIKKPDSEKQNEMGRYNNDHELNDSFDESSNSNYEHSPGHEMNEFRLNPTNEVNNDLFPRKSNMRSSNVLKPEQQEQINLDLNELTQEDKFFLIQQIEDLNKNIRYCQNNQNIYEEDDDEAEFFNPEVKRTSAIGLNSAAKKRQSLIRGGTKGLDIILDEEED